MSFDPKMTGAELHRFIGKARDSFPDTNGANIIKNMSRLDDRRRKNKRSKQSRKRNRSR